MDKKEICVVVPIYKAAIDSDEAKSLTQALKIFSNYSIIFSHPKSLDLTNFLRACEGFKNCSFMSFDDKNFIGVRSYSNLLCQREFYEKFSQFRFMLIYQLDAYAFADELQHWCEKGFDYIGAPWFKNFDQSGKETEFLPYAGNGGFSLRNVQKILQVMDRDLSFAEFLKFRKILRKYRTKSYKKILSPLQLFLSFFLGKRKFHQVVEIYSRLYSIPFEDYFFAQILREIFPDFRSATYQEAIAFSFEVQPEKLFELNGNKLPFGCHAWQKYSPKFFEKFIK